MGEDGPSLLTMVGIVAVAVAAVILIFFGIGYALGRILL
jgi:preprotein translocase subunit SecE